MNFIIDNRKMELVENIYINNKNIPIINLFYRESRIFIESNCY